MVPPIHGQPSGLRSSLGIPRHPLVVTRVLTSHWKAPVWGRSPESARCWVLPALLRNCPPWDVLEATLLFGFLSWFCFPHSLPSPTALNAAPSKVPCWSPEAPLHNPSPRAYFGNSVLRQH